MRGHIKIDMLAEFSAGALKPRKAARVRSHLARCSLCQDSLASLERVPRMLANVDFPSMPAQLSVKIEMAIASESAARIASQPESDEASRRNLPVRTGPRRQWRMPGLYSPLARSLAAAGAAVIVIGGGYEIATHAGASSPSTSSSAVKAPAAAPAHVSAPSAGPPVSYRSAGQAHSITPVRTNVNFTSATLRSQAKSALAAVQAT